MRSNGAGLLAIGMMTAFLCGLGPALPGAAQTDEMGAVAVSSGRLAIPSAPAAPTRVRPGPGPGEVTFTVKTEGLSTDLFRVATATTPFNDGARDKTVFKFPFERGAGTRSYSFTLTAAQTAKAQAGIGVGWTLIWQMHAVNKGRNGDRRDRYFGQDQVRVPGQPGQGEGSIRVASYNVRNDTTFDDRAPLLGASILDHQPGIVMVQELFKFTVADFKRGLEEAGNNGRYVLTRETNLTTGAPGERTLQARILYDTDRYMMVSDCPPDKASCYIAFDAPGGDTDYAVYAKFRDLTTRQEFWVVSFHLPHGPYDDLRRREMEQIIDGVDAKLGAGAPVILGGDTNSSQLRPGERPHDVLMNRGFYDTASTVTHVNAAYGTANAFEYQEPKAFSPSPRIDLIATRGMPGSDRFENVVIKRPDPFPSDHNMIVADLKLPPLL